MFMLVEQSTALKNYFIVVIWIFELWRIDHGLRAHEELAKVTTDFRIDSLSKSF